MQRMSKKNEGKKTPAFLSTHPSSEKRIENLNNWISEVMIKYPPIKSWLLVSPDGLEPSTPSLKGRCSTNWAKGPKRNSLLYINIKNFK